MKFLAMVLVLFSLAFQNSFAVGNNKSKKSGIIRKIFKPKKDNTQETSDNLLPASSNRNDNAAKLGSSGKSAAASNSGKGCPYPRASTFGRGATNVGTNGSTGRGGDGNAAGQN